MEAERTAYVYALRCGPFFKVGRTVTPQFRLRGLQCGNPFKLTLVFHAEIVERGVVAAEGHAKKLLAEHHHRDEWFRAPLPIIRKAIRRGIKLALADKRLFPDPVRIEYPPEVVEWKTRMLVGKRLYKEYAGKVEHFDFRRPAPPV